MAAEIIEIKSVSLSPNPVQTGGKVKISVGLEANESDVFFRIRNKSSNNDSNGVAEEGDIFG